VFLLRYENTELTWPIFIAAINTEQHRIANNKKLILEKLVRCVDANLQAIIHIINCLRIKKGSKGQRRQYHQRRDVPPV